MAPQRSRADSSPSDSSVSDTTSPSTPAGSSSALPGTQGRSQQTPPKDKARGIGAALRQIRQVTTVSEGIESPPSDVSQRASGSFVLQEWGGVDAFSDLEPSQQEAAQLSKLAQTASFLAEAHREVANLVDAAGKELETIEQQVDETLENTHEAVGSLADASKTLARGWTLKAGGSSAAVGMGIGFLVGGPVGAAVIGGSGAVVGAIAGKAAKRRHNRKIDKMLLNREEAMDERRRGSSLSRRSASADQL